MSPHASEILLCKLEPAMLLDGLVERPEEVEAQDWVPVAPFADGLAAFGGDEAAAGGAGGHVVI